MMFSGKTPDCLFAIYYRAPRTMLPEERDAARIILAEMPFQSSDNLKALEAVAGGLMVTPDEIRRFWDCHAAFLRTMEACA